VEGISGGIAWLNFSFKAYIHKQKHSKYNKSLFQIYTFKALKITDKRRGERILLFSSIDVIVAFMSLKSVCLPPNVWIPTYSIELNTIQSYSY
jgi:hypothetical protein